jgi:heme/copper-type cytochrome/quinol oxidase subunit 2
MMLAQSVSMDVFGIIILALVVLLAIAIGIWAFVFWILMIIDAAQRKSLSDGERIAWILVLVFIGIIGALIYYFAVKRNRKR